MKRVFQLVLFIIIQIIFIPFAIIGLMLGLYKEMYISKKLGVSFSAGQSLQYRWIMHYFETRDDPLTARFTKRFPCESHLGLLGVMGALIISQRLFGFKVSQFSEIVDPGYESIERTSGIRVLRFDRVMEKYIDEVDQIVIPGAGFDLMSNKYTKDKPVKVFEIDQQNTSRIKQETMKKANIEHDYITYVEVDYSKDSWVEKLIEAGFDKTKKTLFIWQSVSLYLEEELVTDSLKQMAELSTKDSIIVQDFYSLGFLKGDISKAAKKQMDLIAKNGEPWKFGLEMKENPKEAVGNFLKKCNLEMTDYYLFGENLDVDPFYCIVEAKKSTS